jgi:hypothetical protein
MDLDMRTKTGLGVLVGAVGVMGCLSGCQEGFWGGEPKPLTPREQLGISEVPIPTGFEMDEAGSEDRSTGGWRYIRHTYKGQPDPQLVRAFYHEQMPHAKWRLIDDQMRQGQYTMHFENDLESCEVSISRVKKQWSTKTELQIEVTPRGRGNTLKPAPK